MRQHRVVVDEAARGEHDAAARTDGVFGAVAGRHHADDLAAVDDEALDAGVDASRCAGALARLGEAVHEEVAGGVGELRMVSAGHRI